MPTRSARIVRLPVPLMRAAGDLAARDLFHRDRLAGHHRLVDDAAALDDRRRRPALSRRVARATTSPTSTARDRHVDLRRRRESRERSLAPARAAAGSRRSVRPRARNSSTWPEEHEHGDHHRSVEVGFDDAVDAEAVGEERRRERAGHAERDTRRRRRARSA